MIVASGNSSTCTGSKTTCLTCAKRYNCLPYVTSLLEGLGTSYANTAQSVSQNLEAFETILNSNHQEVLDSTGSGHGEILASNNTSTESILTAIQALSDKIDYQTTKIEKIADLNKEFKTELDTLIETTNSIQETVSNLSFSSYISSGTTAMASSTESATAPVEDDAVSLSDDDVEFDDTPIMTNSFIGLSAVSTLSLEDDFELEVESVESDIDETKDSFEIVDDLESISDFEDEIEDTIETDDVVEDVEVEVEVESVKQKNYNKKSKAKNKNSTTLETYNNSNEISLFNVGQTEDIVLKEKKNVFGQTKWVEDKVSTKGKSKRF